MLDPFEATPCWGQCRSNSSGACRKREWKGAWHEISSGPGESWKKWFFEALLLLHLSFGRLNPLVVLGPGCLVADGFWDSHSKSLSSWKSFPIDFLRAAFKTLNWKKRPRKSLLLWFVLGILSWFCLGWSFLKFLKEFLDLFSVFFEVS